jgi:AraC-like DNA-binding protein
VKSLDRAQTDLVVSRIEGVSGVEAIRGRRVGGQGHALFHTEYAVRCVHAGEVQLRYRGQEWRLPAGAAKLACPGEVSVIVERLGGFSEETQVFIEPETFAQIAEASGYGGAALGRMVDGRIGAAERISVACRDVVIAIERRGALEVEEALTELVRGLVGTPPAVLHRKVGIEPRAVRAMRDLLVAEYARNITLDELAREAGMSKYYSAHLFKSYVGVSPHRFVTGVRVAHARRLLRRSVSCGKVAECCGFSDQSHMTRHFTRLHEISPSRYARGNSAARSQRQKRSDSGAVPVNTESSIPGVSDVPEREAG